MAEACYDPKAAAGLWARMEQIEQSAPPQFLSTHPSSHNRQEKILSWLPEAEMKREEGGCAVTGALGESCLHRATPRESILTAVFCLAGQFRDTFDFKW